MARDDQLDIVALCNQLAAVGSVLTLVAVLLIREVPLRTAVARVEAAPEVTRQPAA